MDSNTSTPERPREQPLSEGLELAAVFGTLAATLLLAPVPDDTALRAVGREAAALVWRHLVLDLMDHAPVRHALLRLASCRYWLRRLATEAAIPCASFGPALAGDDPIWFVWHSLASEIRAAERST